MADSPSGGYREKYRQALEEQDKLEKTFKYQLEALKKTLNHVSIAAQGQDKQLDAALILLKEKMRGATGQQVLEQMERVQSAVEDFEHSRQVAAGNAAKKIANMTERLAQLQLPSNLKKSLESFNKGLKTRLNAPRSYADVIADLGELQQLALDAAQDPEASLWVRLRGGKTIKANENKEGKESKGGEKPSQRAQEHRLDGPNDIPLGEFEEVLDTDFEPKEGEFIQAEAGVNHQEEEARFSPGDEESYEKVSQRIAKTLENLVARIEPNDVVRHKIDIVQMRIQRGMDWYVLAVTLEDIRDILLLRYLQNDHEFTEYLKRVNQELQSISEALGIATEVERNNREVSNKFSDTVSDQMERMRSNVESSKNIDDLKQAVTDHISVISGALGDYKANINSELSISDQLQSLIHRVQQVEAESEKTKAELEAERYRATHDPLTGLPNREAYNERAFHETQRYKRYCRPLTLAVCDIDRFKGINDNFGHRAGDKVLKLIAKLISTRLRTVDFVARYGGEEFVMLMPETSVEQGLAVLDKIRKVIAKTPFKFREDPVNITISFGLAAFTPEDTVEKVFERADKALYLAKNQGRNRCVIASEDGTSTPVEKQ